MKMNAEMKGINVNAGAAKVPDDMLEKVSGGLLPPIQRKTGNAGMICWRQSGIN